MQDENRIEQNKKLKTWAYYKRFLELYYADPFFRECFEENAAEALKNSNLVLDSETAKQAIKLQLNAAASDPAQNEYTLLFRNLMDSLHERVDRRADLDKIKDERYAHWVRSQRSRIGFQSFHARMHMRSYFISACFELADGCSGNCPFCCLDAKSLSGVFRYTPKNQLLWQEILHNTREVLGEIAGSSICYFGTEPFDNPDYEKFITDSRGILDVFPQTTTVASVRNVSRTKKLIELLGKEALYDAALRFSVVSLEQLKNIYKYFSIEDLACIEIALNNPESLYSYSFSGRARNLKGRYPDKAFEEKTSCVCVNGFVVNMLRKDISLVTAYPPDVEYPLGMRVYETCTFENAEEYGSVLHYLIEKWMPVDLPGNRLIKIELPFDFENNYLTFHGDCVKRVISGCDSLFRVLERLRDKPETVENVLSNAELRNCSELYIREKLQLLYDLGYIVLAG
ncbi:MAG TPA: radical SAM family RiPP maturation amino acid epimerase [Lachnospiraceae bacterium]|nr:radical SAM family RiPP maturation amino acid epimerase [Lachnospiraceae bacterium]